MTAHLQNNDLKSLADPLARFVFLDDEGLTEACELIGISENRFLVRSKNNQAFLKKRDGYFVGKEGSGILRFHSVMERVASLAAKEENLYWISPDLNRCEVINRRSFNRFQIKYIVPVYFRNDQELIKASLVNISESGLRMTVQERLSPNVIHQLELTLPCGAKSFQFKSDGVVVYSEPETDPNYFLTGISFVAPTFDSDEDRVKYQRQRHELGVFLKDHPDFFDLI